jgi:excisionase family DNA binding protein
MPQRQKRSNIGEKSPAISRNRVGRKRRVRLDDTGPDQGSRQLHLPMAQAEDFQSKNGPERGSSADAYASKVFLTTAEAASYLNISPVTLAGWRVQGRGPQFRRFGRAVRYAQSDLDGFAEQQAMSSTSETCLPTGLKGADR